MHHSTTLHNLPHGLEFPPGLNQRVHFDLGKKRLIFHGFMTKAEYDQLFALHRDLEYQRAVERLFQASVEDDGPQFRRFGQVLAVLVILCLALGGVVWWQILGGPRTTHNQGQAQQSAPTSVEKGVLDVGFQDGGTVREAGTAPRRN